MEGPAVKRFVTAPSISWSMLTSEYLSGRHGRFPEDAGARLTMERLRRRIRLICAGCSEEQSRMTPLRRELPPSRGASRPDPETGRRIATFRCRTRATDPVFIRSACVRTRPNAPIPLTIDTVIRDREGAARIHSARYAAHAVSLSGGAMVRRAYRQRSLVEVLLPDGDKLWDPTLRQIDTLLDDDVLIDRVTEALAQRHPQSQRRGRLGTPATVVLRMLVLKHLSDWTFDECEREVRGSLVYRAFCRIDGERVPDAKTLIRLARLLDEPVLKDVLARLVALGRERHAERALTRTRRHSHAAQLSTTVELVRRVLAQTRARVLHGDTHYPDKVVSLFEPHTDIIRKGKLTKPTEFGRLVKIQEAEAQFITDYAVCERRQSEQALWGPALDRHIELFDGAPQLAVADVGFALATNERAARERGVRHVVLPRQPREPRSRGDRMALRWRTGSEGRNRALQLRHGLRRCRYRGASGMQRGVGLGVIANNLLVLGRAGP